MQSDQLTNLKIAIAVGNDQDDDHGEMAMELSSIRIGLVQHDRKSRAGVLLHPNEERSSVPRVDKKDLARRLPQLAYVSGEIG